MLARGDGPAALALVVTALVLTLLEYLFLPPYVEARLRGLPRHALPAPSLDAGLIWAAGCIVGYALLPALLVRLVERRPLSDVGYRLSGTLRHLPVYLGLYALMLPAVWLAARRPDFAAVYPFVPDALASRRAFVTWELAYLAQFFALEAFFRGYLLFTLERRIGRLAVFVMVVPYGMIHFHKPMLEALGAIAAGVVLGFLALRYRSFYGGALLHALVALTMDGLAARRAGLF